MSGEHVARFLDEVARETGLPQVSVVGNGPEFVGSALDQWAHSCGVALHFIQPGKPTQNAFVESFNRSFRVECRNANWSSSVGHAREVVAEWWRDYNEQRPHSALGGVAPIEYERQDPTRARMQTVD